MLESHKMQVVDGLIKKMDEVVFMGHELESKVTAVGVMTPELVERDELRWVTLHHHGYNYETGLVRLDGFVATQRIPARWLLEIPWS